MREHMSTQDAEESPPASATAESGQSQTQEGTAGSKRFTPAQQAVAAAVMVALSRAIKAGKMAALTAKMTLVSNDPATATLLNILPAEVPLPKIRHVEDKASERLLECLTQLAEQCKAA
ncbi:g5681 [Coccomyxa viridis]|uniref:G5681 protein n=1 Tax=Coccomyxa viridis TaxID=1274662 RepID=A0ABP1FVZ5_9CHLO